VPGKPGVFNLTVTVPGPVTAFTDRPARRVKKESLASFAARWERRGFGGDPPNAAIVLDDAPAARDTMVVELISRHLVRAKVIRYRVRALDGEAAGPTLARVARGADARVQGTFGRASLFVDPSSGAFATLAFTFSVLGATGPAGITFDGPGQVATTDAGLGAAGSTFSALNAYFVIPGPSGLPATRGSVGLQGAVSPITGNAQLPPGATVTVTVSGPGGAGPPQVLTAGPFSLPIPS
jgi:ribosomal protein S28E/S33